jgi:PKHD-type hydroxylase
MYKIYDLFTEEEVKEITDELAEYEEEAWEDGKQTASGNIAALKKVDQLTEDYASTLIPIVLEKMQVNADVQLDNLLMRPVNLMMTRMKEGYSYKWHTDQCLPAPGSDQSTRADLSWTLFLNDPDTYEGGELVIYGQQSSFLPIKLKAGQVIFYPASLPHQVNEVTKGVRFVANGWMQCLVNNLSNRDLCVDSFHAVRRLERLSNLVKEQITNAEEEDQQNINNELCLTTALVDSIASRVMLMFADR